MDKELTPDCIKLLGHFSLTHCLLAWDSFDLHQTEKVHSLLKTSNIDDKLILGGCTKYVQAPGLLWNKPFKGLVTELYDKWLANGVQEYTEQGNLKPPSRKVIVEWIMNAWNKLIGDIIKKLFKACALNFNIDGLEDSCIYHFKQD